MERANLPQENTEEIAEKLVDWEIASGQEEGEPLVDKEAREQKIETLTENLDDFKDRFEKGYLVLIRELMKRGYKEF